MLIRKLNMPKTKWDGVEDPTINNFHTIDHEDKGLQQETEDISI